MPFSTMASMNVVKRVKNLVASTLLSTSSACASSVPRNATILWYDFSGKVGRDTSLEEVLFLVKVFGSLVSKR